jgi:5-methylcytosine-specific restriction endonuclease McrA
LLSKQYIPLAVISWRHAIVMKFRGKCEALHDHRHVVHRSRSGVIYAPSVVRLRATHDMKLMSPKFSRENVFIRDRYTCQYCGIKRARSQLSIDHVIPKFHGGRSSWENVVAACHECNRKKDNKLPDAINMRPLRTPCRPQRPFLTLTNDIPTEWGFYLSSDSE